MIIISLSYRVKKIFSYFQLLFSILLIIIIYQHDFDDPSFSVAGNKESYSWISLISYRISDFFVITLGNIAFVFPFIFLANALLKITHRKTLEAALLLPVILVSSALSTTTGGNFNGGVIGLSLLLGIQKITNKPSAFLAFVLSISMIIFIIYEILKRNKTIDKKITNTIKLLRKNIQLKILSFFNKINSIRKKFTFRKRKELQSEAQSLDKKNDFDSLNYPNEKVYFYNQDYDKKNEFFIQEKNGFRLYKRIRNKIEDKKDGDLIMPKRIFENEQNQKLYEEIFERKKNNFDNSIIRDNFRPKKQPVTSTNFEDDKFSRVAESSNENDNVEQNFDNEELVDYHEREDLLSGLRNNFEKIQHNIQNNHVGHQDSHVERVMFKKSEGNTSVVDNMQEVPQIYKPIEIVEKKEEIRGVIKEIIQSTTTPFRSDIQKNDFQKSNVQSRIGINPLSFIKSKQPQEFKLPDINFLSSSSGKKVIVNHQQAQSTAERLIKVLKDFSVYGKIINYHIGPVITLYEFEPLPGTKSSRVIGLCDDIARSLSAISARISVIPGKNALGIELPNDNREIVVLKDIFDSEAYKNHEYQLPIALGKNIAGEPIVVDLVKMPHLLVAGTTGSGKSVAINVMILSILYALTPEECKFIMIDPKMLELSIYNGIPHLLTPVVTDPKKSIVVLKWVVKEMEERYRLMSYLGVRNIKNFNEKIDEAIHDDIDLVKTINLGFDKNNNEPIKETISIEKKKYPYIVVIVDEMADLMLVAGKEVEFYIQRLAQMARAAGIHIIMATQRPSVDVITGVIKANLPTRISFAVTSKIDSRTILGEQGAEQLLGMGDMLYMASGNKIVRVHGPFVSDLEVSHVVNYLQSFGPPDYLESIINQISSEDDPASANSSSDSESDFDEDYQRALDLVLKEKKVSISYIQRQLRIGYNKSATIVEKMEKDGVVTSPNHQGKRELITT